MMEDISMLVGVPVNFPSAPGWVSGMEVGDGNHLEPPSQLNLDQIPISCSEFWGPAI